jgi:hypothetical protein
MLAATWDTEKDAQEFFQAYAHLIANKYRSEESLPADGPDILRWRCNRGLIHMERRGLDVYVLEGFQEAEAEGLRAVLVGATRKELPQAGVRAALKN